MILRFLIAAHHQRALHAGSKQIGVVRRAANGLEVRVDAAYRLRR